jgi:hypothetical protein
VSVTATAFKVVTADDRCSPCNTGKDGLHYLPGAEITSEGLGVFAFATRDLAEQNLPYFQVRGPMRVIPLAYKPADLIQITALGIVRLRRCTVVVETEEPPVDWHPAASIVERSARLRVEAIQASRRTPPPADTANPTDRRVLELLGEAFAA